MSGELADAAEREKRLLDRLGLESVVTLTGVVDATGATGGRFGGDEGWTFLTRFLTWRVDDSAGVHTEPLQIRRFVTHDELTALRPLFTPYAIVRIRAQVVAAFEGWAPQALLHQFIGPAVGDQQLNEHAERLRAPVTVQDEVFGCLTLDRRLDRYEGKASWNGRNVSVSLSADEPDDFAGALVVAHSLWQNQVEWDRRVRAFAIERLLPLKNGTWLEGDEEELTADDFDRRMILESITVSEDGSFDFWHEDGGLFWGHTIQISGTLSDGPTDADIPG